MTITAESVTARLVHSRRQATTLTVLHPKGGVGRSTTVYMLGAELALRGHRVALIDRDQGKHLSRIFEFYPPGIDGLVLEDRDDVDIRIVDTAPEVDYARALGYLREADWALVPVKGPEAGSVLALPLLMDWLGPAIVHAGHEWAPLLAAVVLTGEGWHFSRRRAEKR